MRVSIESRSGARVVVTTSANHDVTSVRLGKPGAFWGEQHNFFTSHFEGNLDWRRASQLFNQLDDINVWQARNEFTSGHRYVLGLIVQYGIFLKGKSTCFGNNFVSVLPDYCKCVWSIEAESDDEQVHQMCFGDDAFFLNTLDSLERTEAIVPSYKTPNVYWELVAGHPQFVFSQGEA